MLELGENSRQAHEKIGYLLLNSKADMVFFYGKETAVAAEIMKSAGMHHPGTINMLKKSPPCFHTCDMDELSHSLDAYVRKGDLVLLKGSKGCTLWKLSGILTGNSQDLAVSQLPYEEVS